MLKELLQVIKKYVELTRIPVGDRDYYDQQKVEDLEVRFEDLVDDIVDQRVQEALAQHGTKFHPINDSNYLT